MPITFCYWFVFLSMCAACLTLKGHIVCFQRSAIVSKAAISLPAQHYGCGLHFSGINILPFAGLLLKYPRQSGLAYVEAMNQELSPFLLYGDRHSTSWAVIAAFIISAVIFASIYMEYSSVSLQFLCIILLVKWFSCKQHIIESYFLIHSTNMYLLIRKFSPFIFSY